MRTTLLFAVAIAATASGCLLDDEPNVTNSSHGVETHNRLAANRLAANRLAANRLAANRLAANSLSSQKLTALEETAAIMETRSGRQVYAYLMSCALDGPTPDNPEGTTITKEGVQDCVDADDDGVPDEPRNCSLANDPEPESEFDDPKFCTDGVCTFSGTLGLATSWADKKLSSEGQGWVSACMLARINAFATAEGISLRGSHPNLAPTDAERSTYDLEEGAFYGNIFNKNGIDWNACQGADQYDWLNGGAPGDGFEDPGEDTGGSLFTRDCAEESTTAGTTKCGFHYTGLCGDFADTAHACKSQDAVDSFYGGCSESPGKNVKQVITVFIASP